MANSTPSITIPNKAKSILAKAEINNEVVIASVAQRVTGSGGGYKGNRHSNETVALLTEALDSSKVDLASPEALALSMSVSIAFGQLRWVMRPSEDGTWEEGSHPLAPLKFDTDKLPKDAATAVIPPCGEFKGGIEVVAHGIKPASGKAKEKRGIFVYRMNKSGGLSITPAMLAEEGTKAYDALAQAAKDAAIDINMVALISHLGGDNQGGRALAVITKARAPKAEKVDKPAKAPKAEKTKAPKAEPKAKADKPKAPKRVRKTASKKA